MLWRVFALRISRPPPTLRGPSCPRARHEILYGLRKKTEQSLSARCIESTRCPVASKLSVMNHRRFAFLGDLPSPSIFVPPLARTTHSPTLPREPRKVHPTSLPAETLFLCLAGVGRREEYLLRKGRVASLRSPLARSSTIGKLFFFPM